MSKTVHYKGIATKIKSISIQDLQEFAENELILRNKEVSDYYENNFLECLCDTYYEEYFYHPKTNSLYAITREDIDSDEDIIRANVLKNETIEYELRFYNGGAGFSECLEEAFDNL